MKNVKKNKKHHISLNSQFIVVLDGIIFFSVRFCDNSLLVVKMRFQVFFFLSQAKSYKVFPLTRRNCDVVVISALSSLSQYFEVLNFSQDIWGSVNYVPEIKPIS